MTNIDEVSLNDQSSSIYSDDKVAMSWQSLSTLIAHAVHNLKESIRQGQSAYFGEDTTTIVHRIRLLLYVSNCLDKETSVHLKSNKQLRTQHRSLLAALAKLVLSTKVASSAWPTPESLVKLQSNSEDVLVSVRNFMTSAQQSSVEIKESKPSLTCDNNLWRHSPFVIKNSSGISMLGKSDMISATLILADNVRGAMNSFMDSVRDAFSNFENNDLQGTLVKLKANAPMLVAQFRNLSNTTSHLLNSIEEVCQLNQGNAKALILIKSKQPIYSAMGSLFVVSQTITSIDLDATQIKVAYHRLEQCINVIETSIQDIMDATHKQTDDESEVSRDTPTPTQRQYSNRSHMVSPAPLTMPTTIQENTTGSIGDDEDKSGEFTNRPPDIGLNTLMSNPSAHSGLLLDGSLMGDEQQSETSSLHSDFITNSVRQPKEAKLAKFFGEDTMEAARRRDTVTATPINTSASIGMGMAMNTSMSSAGMSLIHGDTPWFLISEIGASDMVLNMEGNVKGGSLHGLVQHLTQHDQLGKL